MSSMPNTTSYESCSVRLVVELLRIMDGGSTSTPSIRPAFDALSAWHAALNSPYDGVVYSVRPRSEEGALDLFRRFAGGPSTWKNMSARVLMIRVCTLVALAIIGDVPSRRTPYALTFPFEAFIEIPDDDAMVPPWTLLASWIGLLLASSRVRARERPRAFLAVCDALGWAYDHRQLDDLLDAVSSFRRSEDDHALRDWAIGVSQCASDFPPPPDGIR